MKIIGGNNVLLAGRGGSIWQRGGSTPPIITATQAPTGHAYTEGTTLGSHPSYATLNNTTNYTSTAGTISSVEWLVNGVAQASGFVVTAGEAVSLRVTDSLANTRTWTIDPSIDATVPAQFAAGNWSVTNTDGTVRIVISALPDDGGSAITDIEYRVNAGAAVSLSGSTTGTYVTLASAADSLEIRAVNTTGAGAWSASKAAPADPAAPTIPGVPTITGASTVGSTLTAVASTPVTGNPTPTRTWEWYWVGNPTSFASGETYVIQAGDVGKEAYVRQIETNSEGTATADSAATPAITAGNFDPATLFPLGSEGIYAPVQPNNVFTDKTGAVAVPGDPVMLVVDQSEGASFDGTNWTGLGPELVPDPTLNDVSSPNWNLGTGWSHNGTQLFYNGGGGWLRLENLFTAGKWYLLEIDLAENSNGTFQIYSTSAYYVFPSAGVHKILWKAPNAVLQMWHSSSAVTINSLSIKEIPGSHLSQMVSAEQPNFRATPLAGQTTDVAINGTFDTDISGWTFSGADATWNAGQLQMITVATQSWAHQYHTVEAGSYIELTAYMQRFGGANTAGLFLYDTGGGSNVILGWTSQSSAGTYTVAGYAVSNQIRASLRSYGIKNAGQGAYFDNVQIKVTPPSGLSYTIRFDNVDDNLEFAPKNAGSNWQVWSYDPDGDAIGMGVYRNSGDYSVVFEDGRAVSAQASFPVGEHWVNGVQIGTITRDTLHDAILPGPSVIAALNSGWTSSDTHFIGGYGSTFSLGGEIGDFIVINGLTTQNRDDLETWMGNRIGATVA